MKLLCKLITWYFSFYLGKFISFLFLLLFSPFLTFLFQYFYSGFLSTRFSFFGKNSIIHFRMRLGIGLQNVQIGKKVIIGKSSVITAWTIHNGIRFSPKIVVGDNCQLGDFIHLSAINSIIIGNNVLTGRYVTIVDNAHGQCIKEDLQQAPSSRFLYSKGDIIIEDNVWIGDKVTILSGVTIGKGSIIGANSVVNSDVPNYSLAAGIPAKIIKKIKYES